MNNGFKKQNNFARASLFLVHYFGVTARVRSVIWKKGDSRQNRSLNKLVRENAKTDERMDFARSGL